MENETSETKYPPQREINVKINGISDRVKLSKSDADIRERLDNLKTKGLAPNVIVKLALRHFFKSIDNGSYKI